MLAVPELLSLVLLSAYYLSFGNAATNNSRLIVFEGETADIPCEYEGAVITIFWKRGEDASSAATVASFVGGVHDGSDDGRITMSSSHSLVIDNVVQADEGLYFCQVLTSTTEDLMLETDVVIAVPPQEPFPTLTLVQPSPGPVTNSSCQFTIAQGTLVELLCEASRFRPSIQLQWRKNSKAFSGAELKFTDNSDGTQDASGSFEFTMGAANVNVSCEASGDSVQGGSHIRTAVICYTESSGDGGQNVTMIVVIVISVLILTAVLIGLVVWMRKLIKDTMVRSNYTKSVSADDDTPSKTRLSNFCYICYAGCCPCMTRSEAPYTETKGKRSSHAQEQPEKKPTAPSAALKARIQQNRKKQEEKKSAKPGNENTTSERRDEESPMLEDAPQTSAQSTTERVNDKPPGARPKTRPTDDVAVVIRDQQAPHSPRWDEDAAKDEAETGF